MRKTTVRLFSLVGFYLIYLFIGAAIFSSIEWSNENKIVSDLRKTRSEFLFNNRECLNDTDLEAFIRRIIEANNRGISAINNLTVEPNWSFGQAVFFSGTVLTTIGYGHVSPLSVGGKIFCIFYAIFGIPMTLIMISACVERLLTITNKIYEKMRNMRVFSFSSSEQQHIVAASMATNSNNNCDASASNVNMQFLTYTHLAIVLAFVLTFFFFIPAAIFSHIEDEWDYLDALYYCFISLTTIGLGDYIPGDHHAQPYRVFYKIATTAYLIVGVMFVMLLISVVTQIPQLNLAKLFSLECEATDPERRDLLADASISSPSYTRQLDDEEAAVTAATTIPRPPSFSQSIQTPTSATANN